MQRVSRGRQAPTRKGWGYDHQRRRKAMVEGLKNGTVPAICARCRRGSIQGDPWEAGHVVSVALGGGPEVRPEHRSCNRKAGVGVRVAIAQGAANRRADMLYRETMRVIR